MATEDRLDQIMEQCKVALGDFVKGNPKPMQRLFSHRDDVTLANPLSPATRGWEQVAATMERAASHLRDGALLGVEILARHVTPDPAYLVWVERVIARVDGRGDVVPVPLRVTVIFRSEDGEWKIVHRHADPIVTARPAESLIQK
jgi:ketosteroid isomerase-like protein